MFADDFQRLRANRPGGAENHYLLHYLPHLLCASHRALVAECWILTGAPPYEHLIVTANFRLLNYKQNPR